MISWRAYGYRMIGAAERFEHQRARYMAGPTLNLTPANFSTSAPAFVGEGSAPPAPHVVAFHLPPPPPPPAPKVVSFHLGPVSSAIPLAAPAVSLPAPAFAVSAPAPVAASSPDCPPCDACPSATAKVAGGFVAGGLLMYFVGLATREHKNKRRRATR